MMTFHLFRFILILFTLSFVSLVSSQFDPVTVTYSNCSSVYCLSCSSPYLCSQCASNNQPVCCPKYCTTCLNMNQCLLCQTNFILNYINDTMIVCTRPTIYTDPYFNQTNGGFCNNGYYLEYVTGSCQSCNVTNCQYCNAYQTCAQCNVNFFPYISTTLNSVNQTVYTQVCQSCIANCANCSNMISCMGCIQGYQLSSTFTCVLCQTPNCYNCINNGVECISCIYGTYLNSTNNQCNLCSYALNGCAICQIFKNRLECDLCAIGFYIISINEINECTPCPQNCYICNNFTNSLNCSGCTNNYGFDNTTGQCIFCGTGCQSCDIVNSSYSNCSNCFSGYSLILNNNTQLFSCSTCQYPCVSCFSNSICSQCETGFFVILVPSPDLQVGHCYFCNIQNCISCSTQYNCIQCEDGYYIKFQFDNNTYGCTPCPGHCSLCSVPIVNLSSLPVCNLCSENYTLQQQGICAKCKVENCMICQPSDLNFCDQCVNGYTLKYVGGNTYLYDCVSCNIENCEECGFISLNSLQASCYQCSPGYHFIESNTQNQSLVYNQCASCGPNCYSCVNITYCFSCMLGFYTLVDLEKQVVCQPCPSQCLFCNQNGCIYCAEGYYPSPIEQNILPNQTINVQCNLCAQIIKGCVKCFNKVFCKQCISFGQYAVMPSIDGSCISCGQGCIACDKEQVCSNCSDGYLLNTQTHICMEVAGVPVWSVFVIITLGGALIFTLIEKIVRYMKRKNSAEEIQAEMLEDLQTNQRNFHELELQTIRR